jgi:phosphate transport system permease protein
MALPSFPKGMVSQTTIPGSRGPGGLSRSGRSAGSRAAETGFLGALGLSVILVFGVIAAMVVSLVLFSLPAIQHTGLGIFLGTNWDPANDQFGALPFIVGTLATSLLALVFSFPFSLSIALFLGEYRRTGWLATGLTTAIELLAGIPSIIYGAFGLFVLVPVVQQWEMTMSASGVIPLGVGIFTAAVLLAVMIIPYSATLAREVIQLTPQELKEAAYALGGSRFSVIRFVTLPYSFSGIFAGQLLAFGRALGETMAVAMVVGNQNILPDGLFSAGSTISAVIANEYPEASGLHIAALTEIGLILFLITVAFGFLGRILIRRLSVRGNP